LLLQPEENLPAVVILDEPELGLHPYAINVVAGLLQSVSQHAQVILATQSATFVDCFHPEQIIVVGATERSRVGGINPLVRLDEKQNVFGGT
jgi:predicted ATPase